MNNHVKKVAFTLAEVFSPHPTRHCRIGFTLAEVLITLGIIGVVAALTIPNLTKRYEERAIISKYKKMYSTLSNAYNSAVAEQGAPIEWDIDTNEKLMNILKPYLNVTEECYYKKGCVSDGEFVSLNGILRYGELAQSTQYVKNRLNGGFGLIVVKSYPKCSYTYEYVDNDGNTQTGLDGNNCGTIYGVVNNVKKKSNAKNYFGKDHFSFTITKNGLYPSGYNTTDGNVKKSCDKTEYDSNGLVNGSYCGTYIQRYDNMDYFYKK